MGQQTTVGSHKTTVFTKDGWTRVTYHSTRVVNWDSKAIVLDSGGHRTTTTKTRMNQASNQFDLEYRVFQKNFSWYVEYRGETMDFTDGMLLKR